MRETVRKRYNEISHLSIHTKGFVIYITKLEFISSQQNNYKNAKKNKSTYCR